MADRWYYALGSQVLGPATAEQVLQKLRTGELRPEAKVWPETGSAATAVEARAAFNLGATKAAAPAPEWLSDVRAAQKTPAAPKPAVPDWLADVAEEAAGESNVPIPLPSPPAADPRQAATMEYVPAPVSAAPPPMPTVAKPPPGGGQGPLPLPGAGVQTRCPVPQGTQLKTQPLRVQVGGFSSVGQVRERNEDRFFTQHWTWTDGKATREGALLVVADGMGGYQGGDRASAIAVRIIAEHLLTIPLKTVGGTDAEPATAELQEAVVRALSEANRVVLAVASSDPQLKGMGATAAVVLVWDGRAIYSHVGDCRVYLQRGDALQQLTRDQTLVARMVDLGQLAPEEAANHPNKNEVMQAIGKRGGIDPSRGEQVLQPGDRLLVACDGLDAHVDVAALRKLVVESTLPPSQLAALCVRRADEGGGSDNCTVVVAQCT